MSVVCLSKWVSECMCECRWSCSLPPSLSLQPQYEFIHEAIKEAITYGDTSLKAPELKEWLAKLEPDSETGKTVLEEQFTVSAVCVCVCVCVPASVCACLRVTYSLSPSEAG